MSVVTISLSDSIAATLRSRAEAAGLSSTEEYLLALVRADCEQAELESLLETRLDGPSPRWGLNGSKNYAPRPSAVVELRLERHPAVGFPRRGTARAAHRRRHLQHG